MDLGAKAVAGQVGFVGSRSLGGVRAHGAGRVGLDEHRATYPVYRDTVLGAEQRNGDLDLCLSELRI